MCFCNLLMRRQAKLDGSGPVSVSFGIEYKTNSNVIMVNLLMLVPKTTLSLN